MTPQIEPEEAQAIEEIAAETQAASPGRVRARDFREPRRLSEPDLRRVTTTLAGRVPDIVREIAVPLRATYKVSLHDTEELNAALVFDGLDNPFLVLEFRSGPEPGWLVWDSAAAAATIERVLLGTTTEEAEARRLSAAESCVLQELLSQIVRPLAAALDLTYEAPRIVQDLEELTVLDGDDLDADTQRLRVHLAFDGPGGASDMRLYLPGISGGRRGQERSPARDLPEHLGSVGLDVRALLGAVDVPLEDLLELEVGDVVPLGVSSNTPLELYIEDRSCAKARWGKSGGRLAVQILEFDVHPGEMEPPSE